MEQDKNNNAISLIAFNKKKVFYNGQKKTRNTYTKLSDLCKFSSLQ